MKTIDEIMNIQLKILSELESLRNHLEKIEQNSLGLVGVDEAAKFLGVSKGYLYQLTSKSLVPFHKPFNKKLFFDLQELKDFLKTKEKERTNGNLDYEEIDNNMLNNLY
jgi:excisionase family DNA binding protein